MDTIQSPTVYQFTVGTVRLRVATTERNAEGRMVYAYALTGADLGTPYTGDDLHSGCQGGDAKEGMESLLSFLGAAGEEVEYERRTGQPCEEVGGIPRHVAEWADQHSDELAMLLCEVEESA